MNEKQRDGMERAGEKGEIIDRRAGERRAAAPVVAVVAADLSSLTLYSPTWSDRELTELSGTQAAMEVDNAMGKYVLLADVQALASQAQAAVSAPVPKKWELRQAERDYGVTAESCMLAELAEYRLAAQAAVGVASQQEQRHPPSCDAALRAAPDSQLDEGIAGAVARGWCAPENGYKVMDSVLAFAIIREVEKEFARRFRAPGGNTNDKASPDLASIASQAQGDTELLNFVDEMTLSIRCRDICGGADDADVGFEVIEHHMTKPQEREIGFGNSVRAAIRAAIKHSNTPTES